MPFWDIRRLEKLMDTFKDRIAPEKQPERGTHEERRLTPFER